MVCGAASHFWHHFSLIEKEEFLEENKNTQDSLLSKVLDCFPANANYSNKIHGNLQKCLLLLYCKG